jgi:hypothetical protein
MALTQSRVYTAQEAHDAWVALPPGVASTADHSSAPTGDL